jgi:hypothetical protein
MSTRGLTRSSPQTYSVIPASTSVIPASEPESIPNLRMKQTGKSADFPARIVARRNGCRRSDVSVKPGMTKKAAGMTRRAAGMTKQVGESAGEY